MSTPNLPLYLSNTQLSGDPADILAILQGTLAISTIDVNFFLPFTKFLEKISTRGTHVLIYPQYFRCAFFTSSVSNMLLGQVQYPLNLACNLSFMSIAVLTISNGPAQVGFFYGGFTSKTCAQFYLWPPSFKVKICRVSDSDHSLLSRASNGDTGNPGHSDPRSAFNLSRRSKVIGWFLLSIYCVACVVSIYAISELNEP
ncbi:hypothetical protein CVT25_011075 [Psilocybe cyanescens]|uniref:Uncharacterized protein n=1 Tax=Psilocybe cyanescens TaxID=93625 RepID=A0A409WFD6_PSICY|nr:hypothetical protein CVT25_011075 [Psilocybe cyanescens]